MFRYILVYIVFILIFVTCSSTETIRFLREDNRLYETKVQGIIIDNRKALQVWYKTAEVNIYAVYWYKTNAKVTPAFILAFDVDMDGNYENILYDIDGDSFFDVSLQGGRYYKLSR